MKTNNQFIFRKIADECLLIPVGEAAMAVKGLIALSESGGLLYERVQAGCTRAELIAALMAEYEVPEATAAADTDAFLEQLRQLNMLVEE